MRKHLLDEDGIVNLKEMVNALLSFNQVSALLSGDTYATCSLIIPSIKYLDKQLNKKKSEKKFFVKQVLVSFDASGAIAPLCTAQPCTYGRYRPVSIQKIFKIQIEAIRAK